MEFFANGTLEGTDSSAPYTHSWGNVPAGSYSLTARAVDDDGAATVSQPVSIGVTDAPPPPGGGGTASLFVAPGGSDGNPCSQAAPCASFDRAYRVASPGAVVQVAAGTYPGQTIRAVAGRAGPNVVFQPPAGARVVLGGLSFDGADFVTVRDMETTYKGSSPGAGNQQGVHAGPGSSYITLENLDAGSVRSWKADHLTVKGGDYGPCDAVTGNNVCSNNMQDVSTNVLIEGAYFHDLEYDPSAPDAHWECMYLNGGRNVTIRGNRFERCAIFDLFVTISGPDAEAIGHENLTIENNWFGPATNGLGIRQEAGRACRSRGARTRRSPPIGMSDPGEQLLGRQSRDRTRTERGRCRLSVEQRDGEDQPADMAGLPERLDVREQRVLRRHRLRPDEYPRRLGTPGDAGLSSPVEVGPASV